LRVVGAGTTTIALGACGDNHAGADAAAAVLEPTATGFLVSVWARGARSVTVAIISDGLSTMREVMLGDGGTGVVAFDDLEPGTEYEVVLVAAGAQLGPHRVRTAPSDDDPRAVRIAVGADIDPHPKFDSDLVEHVLAARPELFVSLGDFPYTDNGPPAQTLDEYRERYVETRTAPRVRALLEGVGVRAIYDDHEFRNNWDGACVAAEANRYAAAIAAWDEFFPLRDAAGEVRYRKFRWGANVECFVLDVRRFRSANAQPDDGAKSMLGERQRRWLLDGLAASTAPFKLVCTPVPLDFTSDGDAWNGFLAERQVIFDAIVGIPGVLFVSADQHYFAAYRHAYGIREIQVGPFARGLGTFGPQVPGVVFRALRYNVGIFDVARDRLVVGALGDGGERFYEETLTIDDLTPRRPR
jgi:hypothetical protein